MSYRVKRLVKLLKVGVDLKWPVQIEDHGYVCFQIVSNYS